MDWARKVIDDANETAVWLRGVILGEWEDNRSISQIVADALTGFVPGVGSIITLRDLLAVIVRLAKYPEKRQEVEEWILLIAMLLPLIVTALGALVAGIGALVGAELGAFLRALTLMLVKKGGVALKALVEFFQHHGYGDVVSALRKVKFASYKDHLLDALYKQIDKLVKLIESVKTQLASLDQLPKWLPGQEALRQAMRNADLWIARLGELKKAAREMIPKSLIELDNRLGALLAGDIKAATQATHQVSAGIPAPKPPKPEPVLGPDGKPTGVAKTKGNPEPGNTRRVAERRFIQHVVQKEKAEFRLANRKGIPVGAKPYVAGKTIVENPPADIAAWKAVQGKTKEGYPDLSKDPFTGKRKEIYPTFSKIEPYDIEPGKSNVRVVGPGNYDTGPFWTERLPEDGRQFRAGTAVKEIWNSNGTYVQVTAPPKGSPVWQELHELKAKEMGVSPGDLPYVEKLQGWKGTTASQQYEYIDPVSKKRMGDDFYLPGGDEQTYLDPKQLNLLKERGFVSDRKPTSFKDYDPTVKNPDGTTGNIVPNESIIIEYVAKDEALLMP